MKKLRLSVNVKVSIGIMIIMVCVGIIGLQVFMVTQQKSAIDQESIVTYETIAHLQQLKIDLARIEKQADNYAVTFDEASRLEYEQLRVRLTTDFVTDAAPHLEEGAISELQTTLSLIPADLSPVKIQTQEVISDDSTEASEDATSQIEKVAYEPDAGLRYITEFDLQLSQAVSQQEQALQSRQAVADSKAQELIQWIIFGTVLCGSAALFTAWIVVVSVTRPLVNLNSVIEAISKGDISTQIQESILNQNDEIGDLARSFDRTMVSLKLAIQRTQSKGDEKKKEE